LSNQNDHVAGSEARFGGERHVRDHADAADGGSRRNPGAPRLVIERDIAGNDREIQRPRRFANAFETADELAHDLGLFGIAEIEIIGQRQGFGARDRNISPAFGDRLLAALIRVGAQ